MRGKRSIVVFVAVVAIFTVRDDTVTTRCFGAILVTTITIDAIAIIAGFKTFSDAIATESILWVAAVGRTIVFIES